MKKRLFFLFPVLVLLLSGCDPCRRLSRRCPPEAAVRDSLWRSDTCIIERWHTDTLQTIALPEETVRSSSLPSDTAFAETSFASAFAYLSGNQLRLLLRNKDSAEVLARKIRELQRQVSEKGSFTKETVVETRYRTPAAVSVLAGFGGLCLLLLAVSAVLRFLSRKR